MKVTLGVSSKLFKVTLGVSSSLEGDLRRELKAFLR